MKEQFQLRGSIGTETDDRFDQGLPQAFHRFPVKEWDRYEFIELIGEGGMGRVYRALDLRLKREVALKFLTNSDEKMIERFFREAQAQARIEHENICKVYEVGEVEGQPYIAMQYIEGLALNVAKDRLTLQEKVKIVRDVALAIQAAHDRGLIHRDIKPANIILEKSIESGWRPFVMDFGLAREVETSDQTKTNMLMGTPAYMAPEQVARAFGESDLLNRPVDIYSLGATLYELLTGRPPFGNGMGLELLMQVMQADATHVRKINPNIAVDLDTIVMKCLEKDPARRYESAQALAEDLQRYLDSEPILARPTTLIYRVTKKARKYRALVAVIAIAVVAVLALAVVNLQARWTTAKQVRLAQQFGQEVKELESLMRFASMLPLHDTKAKKEQVRARMQRIAAQMEALQGAADGPGNYALGRGHLALLEYETARQYLEKALSAGYQGPEVKYALGQALGALYQKQLEEAQTISNKELREARKQQLEQQYRDPALAYLKASSGLQVETATYVEGLIAFYEKRYDDALQKAEQASALVDWLYEARRLAGDIYLARGIDKQSKGDYDGAAKDYHQAGGAYAAAQLVARSDSSVYEQDCYRWVTVMTLSAERGQPPNEAFEQAIVTCNKAMQADSQNWQAANKKAVAYLKFGEYQAAKGEDPRAVLEKSLLTAEQTIASTPTATDAFITAGASLVARGHYEQGRGLDPRPSLERAADFLQRAVQIDPRQTNAYFRLGSAFYTRAKYEQGQGLDIRPALERAADYFQKAVQTNANSVSPYYSLATVYWHKGDYEREQGIDPRPSLKLAREWHEQGLKINPNFANCYVGLGLVNDTQGLYERTIGEDPRPALNRAVEYYRKALQINPNLVICHSNLGTVYNFKASYEMSIGLDARPSFALAIESFQKALQINPNYLFAHNNLGDVYHTLAQYEMDRGLDPLPSVERATECFEKVIALNPNFASGYGNLGLCYNLRAQIQQAQGLNARALNERALALVHKAIQLNPQYVDYYGNLGGIYNQIAEYEQARGQDPRATLERSIAASKKALEINATYVEALNQMASAYLIKGRYEQRRKLNAQPSLAKALELCQQAIGRKADYASAHINIGFIYLSMAEERIRAGQDPGDLLTKAHQALEQAKGFNPHSADIYQALALRHRWQAEWNLKTSRTVQGEIEKGLAMAERALAINARHKEASAVKGTLQLLQARAELRVK